MSGGKFNYKQHHITDIADSIEDYIKSDTMLDWMKEDPQSYDLVIHRMKLAVLTLRAAHVMAHRIDWLLSADDGPDSFLRRWDEDLSALGGRHEKDISSTRGT